MINKNLDFVFKLFNEKDINYSKEAAINFSIDIENGKIIGYSFKLWNDNLSSGNMNYTTSLMNYLLIYYLQIFFQNNNNLSNNYNPQNVSQINNYQQMNNNNNDYIIEFQHLKKTIRRRKRKKQNIN